MDLMQLEMFVAAVEEGNFRKAASRVYRTQPAVSMALKKLEEESGVALFNRSDRNAYGLTDAGQSLYGYAKRMLCLREEAMAEMSQLQKAEVTRFTIGTADASEHAVLCDIVSAIADRCPDSTVEVIERPEADLLRGLRDSSLDIALLREQPEDEGLASVSAAYSEYAILVSPGHRWSGRRSLKTIDVVGEPFIVCKGDEARCLPLIQSLKRLKSRLEVKAEVPTVDLLKHLAASGVAAGIAPAASATEEVAVGELVAIKLSDVTLPSALWLSHRKAVRGCPAVLAAREVIQNCPPGMLDDSNTSAFVPEQPVRGTKHLKLLVK